MTDRSTSALSESDTLVLEIPEQVRDFLAAVRLRLQDLPLEEQQDLTDGLEADLTELLADQGPEVLGDPDRYARELRTAAGLTAYGPTSATRGITASIGGLLDAVHQGWDRIIAALPGDASGFLATLRPVWWVIRAWAAVSLLLMQIGYDRYINAVPFMGTPWWGWGPWLLGGAVLGSVTLGRWWSRRPRSGWSRLGLIALNTLAVLTIPVTVGIMISFHTSLRSHTVFVQPDTRGQLTTPDGNVVTNVLPYDAEGNPLVGVQLFDQDGKPIKVTARYSSPEGMDNSVTLVPWFGRDGAARNVFPLGHAREGEAPELPARASLSPGPVRMVGATPSVLVESKVKRLEQRKVRLNESRAKKQRR